MAAMSVLAYARVIASLLRGAPNRGSHAERLEHFYGPQADAYDDFRERLLHGRRELIDQLPARPGDRVVEIGGGTGRNAEFFGPRPAQFASFEIVDLCEPLLEIARARTAGRTNVRVTHADATEFRPAEPVDCVYFSYALIMIPDWRRAVRNAIAMLKPGGTLGVVDFYVSTTDPEPGLARHGRFTRTALPLWFSHDGVVLSPDHLPYVRTHLEQLYLSEQRAPLPYLPWIKAPYYIFVGRKRQGE